MTRSKRVSDEQPPSRLSKAPPSLAPRSIEAETVATVNGVEGDFTLFLAVAHAVDAAKVQTFRGDPSLAYHNVVAGLEIVLAQKAAVVASGFKVDWALLDDLPRIALGLAYAVEQVDGRAGANALLQKRLARGRVLYDIAISSAQALVNSGNLQADKVKKLRTKSGPLNLARALVKVADFFTKHRAEVKGMTPFMEAEAKEAAELGRLLLTQVKPKGTRPTKDAAFAKAQHDRDCFAALLVERYELLERVAGSVWGRSVDEHVPAIQSRRQTKPRAKKPAKAVAGDVQKTGNA